jgi:polysaccharide biosynthesis/export protein
MFTIKAGSLMVGRCVRGLINFIFWAILGLFSGLHPLAQANPQASINTAPPANQTSLYHLNPGDILAINVANEDAFNLPQVLVQPDGYISVPLVGHLLAAGKTLTELQDHLKLKMKSLLKDEPILTVSLIQLNGNTVFVLGKVNRPGAFIMARPIDVTQALALAGGLAPWAKEDDIIVLRRNAQGEQVSLKFDYQIVKKGRKLESNILLTSGDLILVP